MLLPMLFYWELDNILPVWQELSGMGVCRLRCRPAPQQVRKPQDIDGGLHCSSISSPDNPQQSIASFSACCASPLPSARHRPAQAKPLCRRALLHIAPPRKGVQRQQGMDFFIHSRVCTTHPSSRHAHSAASGSANDCPLPCRTRSLSVATHPATCSCPRSLMVRAKVHRTQVRQPVLTSVNNIHGALVPANLLSQY